MRGGARLPRRRHAAPGVPPGHHPTPSRPSLSLSSLPPSFRSLATLYSSLSPLSLPPETPSCTSLLHLSHVPCPSSLRPSLPPAATRASSARTRARRCAAVWVTTALGPRPVGGARCTMLRSTDILPLLFPAAQRRNSRAVTPWLRSDPPPSRKRIQTSPGHVVLHY